MTMRAFVGIDLGRERRRRNHDVPLPPSSRNPRSGGAILEEVHRHLKIERLKVSAGTIVDATIIHARVLDQCRQGARSRHASDQEGRSMVFWHEGACRDRQQSPRSSMRWQRPRRRPPTARCWAICCMAKRRVWAASAIAASAKSSGSARRTRGFAHRRYRQNGVVDEAEQNQRETEELEGARQGRRAIGA